MNNSLRYGITSLCLVGCLTGCNTTGLSARERGVGTYSKLVYGLYEKQEDSTPAPLRFPMKLAVAQVGETAPPEGFSEKLRQSHPEWFSDVIALPLPGEAWYGTNGDAEKQEELFRQQADSLRRLSRQVGADYLFMVGGVMHSRAEMKPWVLLDLAILPAFLLPSQKIHIDAQAAGVLIDARSGQIMTFVNAGRSETALAPTALLDEKETTLAMAQKDPLSEALAEKLIDRLELLQRECL